ncbi:MAG: hypothetical protein IAE77_06160 [Prosthecobacter sp.]|nr:hypothetical protein [Prosthecobacter sp.]
MFRVFKLSLAFCVAAYGPSSMSSSETVVLRITHGSWRRQVVAACVAGTLAIVLWAWLLAVNHESSEQGTGSAPLSALEYIFNGEERAREAAALSNVSSACYDTEDVVLIIAVSLAAAAVFLLTRIDTNIEPASRCLLRQWTWLGVPLYMRKHSLTEFRQVQIQRRKDADGWFSWLVVMVQNSGKQVHLQWFDDDQDTCPQRVRRLADEVASVIGLPVVETLADNPSDLVALWRNSRKR